MGVDLEEGAKQFSFAAARAAAAKAALHRAPDVALFDRTGLAGPHRGGGAYRFHDWPLFGLPGFGLPGLRSFLGGLRPGCAFALGSARKPSRLPLPLRPR